MKELLQDVFFLGGGGGGILVAACCKCKPENWFPFHLALREKGVLSKNTTK